jgi:hypothetical protein
MMASPDTTDSRKFLSERTGSLSQIGGITSFTYADGKARGVSTLRLRTAQGLELWVLPDKGLDIFEATYLGRSLCWHSPTGVVHPAYYSSRGLEWLRSFAGGLVCTCGLSTAGAPSEDNGESLGLHGPIANTPAENVTWSEEWQGDDCLLTVAGSVREASVFGPNLLLRRTITTSFQRASFAIHDVVENQGPKESPLMVLYHLNFGYPLLTERSKIYSSSKLAEPSDEFAAQSKDKWDVFEPPSQGMQERVYFHTMEPDGTGMVTVVLVSDDSKRDFGISLRYDKKTLTEFTQWKTTSTNHFVLGLEPGNCRTKGRAAERERGALKALAPGEQCEFRFEIAVLDGKEQVAKAIRSIPNHAGD